MCSAIIMDVTTLKTILLLLFLGSRSVADQTLINTDHRLPIVVESGRSTYLTMANLPINQEKANMADFCQVEVDDIQPLSSALGFIKPKKFPCLFKPNTVLYQHEGSPLQSSDSVILHIYFFRKHLTYIRNVTIQISIIPPKSPSRVILKSHLTVGSSKGISEALSTQIISIKFDSKKEFCQLRHFNQAAASSTVYPWLATRYWPLTGLLITFNKSKVYEFSMECQQALLMGYRFMHRRTRGPSVDFLPLVVEISDFSRKIVIDTTYIQIPIQISSKTSWDLFKSLLPPPVVENFRSLHLKNFGGTISLLPKDIFEVRRQDKDRGPLIVKILSLQGNDFAKFVNMRDPSKAIWSFVLTDLQEGLIGFQLTNYSKTIEKVFRVDLVICDSYFVQSQPLILKIVDELGIANQPFQVFATPFHTYTANIRALQKDHIQIFGVHDVNLIRFRILSMNSTHGSLKRLPSTDLFGKSVNEVKHFNIEDVKNGMISYTHHGGLDDTDLIKIEAYIGRDQFVKFYLSIYIVRCYNRSKEHLLAPMTEFLTPTKGVMQLPLLRLVNWPYFLTILRDKVDISFTLVKGPQFGNLVKLLPWENVTQSAIVKVSLSVSDLMNGLLYYISYPSKSNNRDIVELQQVGRFSHDTSIIAFNIRLYVSNFLIQKMDRNVVFTVMETNQYAKLSYLNLNFVNHNLQPKDVVYRISRCPKYDSVDQSIDAGRLISLQSIQNHLLIGDTVLTTKLRNYRSEQITSVILFTQQQILDNDIVYIPPVDDVGPRDRQVTFLYTVKDTYGYEIRNVPFTIVVKAVNNRAPRVRTSGIIVTRDEETYLTRTSIEIEDEDTNLEELSVEIVRLPSYGRLRTDKNVIILNGSRFAASKLQDNNIKYKHDGQNVKEDSFKVRIFDGVQFSPTYSVIVNITKRIISNSSWNLYINNSVIVKENLTVILHETALKTVMKDFDFDAFSNPTFILVAMPTRGNLIKEDNVISTFFYEEVKDGKIEYQHTATEIGSKAQYDFIQIWVLESGLSFNMNFTILPVNSQVPVIKSQSPLQVSEGGSAVVSYYTLGVMDLDSKESVLNIKVIRPPLWGKIYSKTDKSVISSFSVRDVRLGKVIYANSRYLNGLEQTNDIFTVQAFDEEFASSLLDIHIVIHPTNDEIPNLVLRDFNIAVGESKQLNENIFHVSDADIPRDVLQISVTLFPRFGNLTTLYKHGEVKRITKDSPPLTLQMLRFVSILYIQSKESTVLRALKFPIKDQFELSATDGKHKVFQKCTVNITGPNIYPPVIFSSLIQMDKISEKNITQVELRVKDSDTLPEDIQITLLTPPKLGDIIVGKSPLKRNDIFTQRQINENKVKYKYKGKSVSYTNDGFVIKVFDGSFETPSKSINIFLTQPIQKPKMIISARPIKVEIGRRFVLDRGLFKIENPVPEILKSLIMTVNRRLTCGSMYHYKDLTNPITKFLFVDIETRAILFFISECPEAVKFINIPISLNSQKKFESSLNLYVEIVPRSNRPPVLERNNALDTLIGSNLVLTKDKLLLSDHDTPSDKLVFKHLQGNNSARIGFYINDVSVKSFTQYDINSQKVLINIPEDANNSSSVIELYVTDGNNDGFVLNGNYQLNGILKVPITISNWIDKNLILRRYQAPSEMKFIDGYNGFQWTYDNILVSRPEAKISSAVDLVAGFFYNVKTKQSVKVFTQIDVNKGWIYYFLDKERSAIVSKEGFQFKILYEEFRISSERLTITWNIIEFDKIKYKLCPQRGLLTVLVIRKGDLAVESQALVAFISKEAIIDQDYRLMSQRLLVFPPGQQNNTISIKILLTGPVKTKARFHVTLKSPKQAVVGQKSTTVISIKDREVCGNRTYFLPERSLKPLKSHSKIQGVKDMIQDYYEEPSSNLEGYNLPSSDHLEMRYSDYLQKKKEASKCIKGWKMYSKRCYKPFYNKVSWKTANSHCASQDSYMVSIPSQALSDWLTKIFIKLRSYWIGLHRSESSEEWRYPNNEAVLYTNWAEGFPKTSGQKHRDCVIVTRRKGWKNRPCVKKRNFFICMKNPQVLL